MVSTLGVRCGGPRFSTRYTPWVLTEVGHGLMFVHPKLFNSYVIN